MSEQKRQHLVPKCYLKKFALNRKKNWYLDACNVKSKDQSIFPISINNICVETEFYTFTKLKEKDKRFLERFYSQTIETDYTEVYDILINPYKTQISPNQRFKIISFIICQHFRTAKFTNVFNSFWNNMLESGYNMIPQNSTEKKIYFENNSFIDFNYKDFDDVIRESTIKNREYINLQNYFRFRDLTNRRLNDLIFVNKTTGPHRFISSDIPVIVGGMVYNLNISIHIPINHTHSVSLYPLTEEIDIDSKSIFRTNMNDERSYLQTLFNNSVQIEQCEKFILGSKQTLDKALVESKNFDENDFKTRSQKVVSEILSQ